MTRKLKPKMAIKRIKYSQVGHLGRPVEAVTAGGLGRSLISSNQEVLSGNINGVKASAGEERWARTLNKNRVSFEFRMALGSPRHRPGWFELDFLFPAKGVYRAVEVDSLFTHRDKQYKDALHDAMVLNELKFLGVYPFVYHIDNDRDLSTQDASDATFRSLFG